jgi:hypothetical protein
LGDASRRLAAKKEVADEKKKKERKWGAVELISREEGDDVADS